MIEKEIHATPEHLLEKDTETMSKKEANAVLRGLLAYEIRAHKSSEYINLHSYLKQLSKKRLEVANYLLSRGGQVSSVVLKSSLPAWDASQRP